MLQLFDLVKKGVNPIVNVEVGYCGFVDCDIFSHGKDDKGCQCQDKEGPATPMDSIIGTL